MNTVPSFLQNPVRYQPPPPQPSWLPVAVQIAGQVPPPTPSPAGQYYWQLGQNVLVSLKDVNDTQWGPGSSTHNPNGVWWIGSSGPLQGVLMVQPLGSGDLFFFWPTLARPLPIRLAGIGRLGAFSSAIMSAATALDAQLAAQGCCGCGNASSKLSQLTSAFKQSILTNAGDWGSNSSAPTVTGSTINVSDPNCQIAFGSELGGTLADLKTVLGSAMTYTGSYCSNSSCTCVDSGTNCGSPAPPPPPPPPNPNPSPSPTPAPSSGLSTGAMLGIAAAVLLVAGGGYYVYTHRDGAAAGHPTGHPTAHRPVHRTAARRPARLHAARSRA